MGGWEIGNPLGQFRSFDFQILRVRLVGFRVGLNFPIYYKVEDV